MDHTSEAATPRDNFDWQSFIDMLDWESIAKEAGVWWQEPFRNQYRIIPLDLPISAEEMDLLRPGHDSFDMSGKWDLHFKDDKLFCFRSWNGNCAYIIRFAMREDGFRVCDVLENCDPEQWDGLATSTANGSGWPLDLINFLVGRGRFEWLNDELEQWIWHDPRQIQADEDD